VKVLHRLSNRNLETMTADCSVCGPGTKIRGKGPRKSPQCHTTHHKARGRGHGRRDKAGYLGVLGRDPCAYCGGEATHLDHIVPRSDGGSDDWTNRTAACATCNNYKGSTDLLRYLLYERVLVDVEPLVREVVSLGRGAQICRWA
jgi:hypothetical protein